MKTVSSAMLTYLAGDYVQLATCLLLKLTNGDTIAVTDWQTPVTYGGVTYQTMSQTFGRSAITGASDLSVPSVEAVGLTGQKSLSSGGINEVDIEAGLFDGATFQMFMMVPTDTNGSTYGIVKLRAGRLGSVTNIEGQYTIELRGLAAYVTQTLLRIYTLACNADLFDSRCTVNPAAYTDTGTVTGGISGPTFNASFSANRATNFYNAGVLTWTGGENDGTSIEVQTFTNTGNEAGTIQLYLGTGYPIQVGDTFTAQAGCDKSLATCTNTFNNAINHRGFPFIPGFDVYFYAGAALAYPTSAS